MPVETSGGDAIVLSGTYTATRIDSFGSEFFGSAIGDVIGFSEDAVTVIFRDDGTLTFEMN